jgi:hypothetical protein
MSIWTDITDGIGSVANGIGVSDIFADYSKVLQAKYANQNNSTVTDLQNQVSLLTMQRDLMNSALMGQANTSGLGVSTSNLLPLVLVVGVVGVAVWAIAK